MARTPIVIFGMLNGEAVAEDTVLRRFLFEGYGPRAAKKWIREFSDMGWITNNNDGTMKICVPYRH